MTSIGELQERLDAAELVCILYGWTGTTHRDERGDATLQAWMDWHEKYGHKKERAAAKDPEWDQRIKDLARRRQEIREATFVAIREGQSS